MDEERPEEGAHEGAEEAAEGREDGPREGAEALPEEAQALEHMEAVGGGAQGPPAGAVQREGVEGERRLARPREPLPDTSPEACPEAQLQLMRHALISLRAPRPSTPLRGHSLGLLAHYAHAPTRPPSHSPLSSGSRRILSAPLHKALPLFPAPSNPEFSWRKRTRSSAELALVTGFACPWHCPLCWEKYPSGKK